MSRENVSNRFISSAHDKDGIENTLARMLGNDSMFGGKLNIQFCGECGEQCSNAYQDTKDKSTFYCRQHYEKLVGPVCEGCSRGIVGGETPQVNGTKKYHPACYNVDHSCHRCSCPIVGASTVFSGRQYHNKCFTCTYCDTQLSNTTSVDRLGRPYCFKCNSDLSDPEKAKFMNHSGGATITVTNKEAEERNRIKVEVAQNVQSGKEQCPTCHKTMVDQGVQFAGRVYHQDCFVCNKCKIPIGGQSFVNKSGVPYCQPCGKSPSTLCFGCNQPITSSFTVALDNKYHPQCLVCSGCKKDLKGGYVQVQSQLMCGVCAAKAPSVTTTTYSTGARAKGLVVDPRSGKRTYL
ncbi:hypothetical protein DFA_04864 [Cavenderia fasciculata]|uniref:LIM zinc-binding domain-containing protein n=1 Tax=Cavenderia fasciculata TaxID=261658 RepID=F4PM31_CACFS|nr:uncharacterized protein DFA_04864 [Cavenderia fasciculata]EGG22734.1 hypothetical protein DFA_04864 [Cavenderia fasciculata]|eukprot:XP_004360585.1 hypothetical protein DFA_04864 [Cavenderia fasciculata]